MPDSNIHPSSAIGPDVVIASTARVGPNCYIDGRIRIGEDTTIVGGVTLVGDAHIGDDCLIEPGVSITGTVAPLEAQGPIIVGPGTRIGAGSVIARGVHIGRNVQIDVGTFVSRHVPSHAIVGGNPAGIVGYNSQCGDEGACAKEPAHDGATSALRSSAVNGVRFLRFPTISDARGDLCVGEFGPDFPFDVKRYFVVFNVPAAAHRGEHAHHQCQEILICLQGSLVVVVDDGTRREEIELNDPTIGLYLPPMVWRVQYKYSGACIVLVLASSHYDPSDYIRDYDRFLVEARRNG
jgi:UDP-2-acetamido-3-amino-2,3-dideoxy-glucuronate N-acetyltransferase